MTDPSHSQVGGRGSVWDWLRDSTPVSYRKVEDIWHASVTIKAAKQKAIQLTTRRLIHLAIALVSCWGSLTVDTKFWESVVCFHDLLRHVLSRFPVHNHQLISTSGEKYGFWTTTAPDILLFPRMIHVTFTGIATSCTMIHCNVSSRGAPSSGPI